MTFTFLYIFNRESRYPIFECLCGHLCIGEIIALTRTCRKYSGLYQYLLPKQWDIDRCLRRFVRNPTGLRSKMGETNALISGSFAIQFFERKFWPDSDLDMYVKEGEESDALRRHLVMSEGYKLEDNPDAIDHMMRNMVTIRKYTRPVAGIEHTSTKIHIIGTSDIPIQAILRGFYTTVVVNIIAWNTAYSLHPQMTFIQRKGYMQKDLNEFFSQQVAKYSARGWTIQTKLPDDHRFNHPIRGHRRIGDPYAWKIDFDVSKVEKSPVPDSVLHYSSFSIHTAPRMLRNPRSHYVVETFLYTSPALRYTYAMSCYYMRDKARDKTLLELSKLNPDDRPQRYEEILQDLNSWWKHSFVSFQKPDTWTYWDSEVPRWYDEWEWV
ncbi:MAG: hypothetical protein Q9226_002923 [Calogaya cf. arnoldii]